MSNPDAVRAALYAQPLAEAIKSGAVVPGAHIETRNHLQIR